MQEDNDNSSEQQEKQVSEPGNQEPKTKKSHKKRNIFITLVLILLLLVGIPLLIAGYLGFVPGLSSLMGASKAKDLGVTYTAQDYQNYLAKTQTNYQDFANAPANPANPSKKIVFANPTTDTALVVSQQELTAAINELNWVWKPIDNAQVRITDGTVEISGNIKLDYITQFISFIGGVGYSQADVNKAADWGKKFVNNAPIYIKAQGSVTNNQLQLNVEQVQVGRYTAPVDIAQKVLATGTQNAISNTPGLDAQSATLKDGAITFVGTRPTTIYAKTQ